MSPTSVHGGGGGVVFVCPSELANYYGNICTFFFGFSQTCETSSFGVLFKFYGKNIAGY